VPFLFIFFFWVLFFATMYWNIGDYGSKNPIAKYYMADKLLDRFTVAFEASLGSVHRPFMNKWHSDDKRLDLVWEVE